MAVRTVRYAKGLIADTYRGPSDALWAPSGKKTAGVADYQQDPSLGMYFFDDFINCGTPGSAAAGAITGDLNTWSIYVGSTGVLSDAAIVGGGLTMTPGTAASNKPITLCGGVGAFAITTGTSNANSLQGRLAFEARVALTSVTASKRDAFVGLIDQIYPPLITTPFTAGTTTNQLTSTANLIGFYNQYSGGGQDWCFVYQLASTAPVFVTNLASLISNVTGSSIVAGTYYKIGFVYDPQALSGTVVNAATGQTVGQVTRKMIQIYVNGQPAATWLSSAGNVLTSTFPTGIMTPCVAIMNEVSSVGASTNAGALSIDWLRVAQDAIT
jgi:hypothetical protein